MNGKAWSKKLTRALVASILAITLAAPITGGTKQVSAAPAAISAAEMMTFMGRGTNLGNTFEMFTPGAAQPRDYVSAKSVIDAFIGAGYTTIRMPIRWEVPKDVDANGNRLYPDRITSTGTIIQTSPDVVTYKNLVNYILHTVNPQRASQGLKEIVVIVNSHHENWFYDDATDLINGSSYTANINKLKTMWQGITDMFADAPSTLVFEVLNEPHNIMNGNTKCVSGQQNCACPAPQSEFDAEAARESLAIQTVVDMNKQVYNTIRSYTNSSGQAVHEKRVIMFGGIHYNAGEFLAKTYASASDLPDGSGTDKYLMGTYHLYQSLTKKTKALVNGQCVVQSYDSYDWRAAITDKMQQVYEEFSQKYNIPVFLGEFGQTYWYELKGVAGSGFSTNKNEPIDPERQDLYRFISDESVKRNMAIAVWDDNGDYTVYKRSAGTFNSLLDDVFGDGTVSKVCLNPSNDASIRGGSNGNGNYGSDLKLEVKNDPNADYDREIFLKFPVGELNKSLITNAKLRLYGKNVTSSSDVTLSVFGAYSNWGEGTITWNNQPYVNPAVFGSFTVNGTERYYEFDVTNYVKSQGTSASVAIRKPVTDANRVEFQSKESASLRPQLIITH
ncbi:CBM96 family carbohydrate-binding protein [Paenibacillus roseipurpureus]|uniref:DNRLRE domain-containing protein n=1 Tax=Paenibacillus roseopurpureus TaxID=2918901 RepID=A0AA96LL36_9BACL|nr:DNRLRE domain-containing protein [Paenibacillus sp. MBLB1832]WNR43028.1 DNRLRE domain-containing protein [Paenibacillus sp. MBLB1832]